jgi:hypothetical protein
MKLRIRDGASPDSYGFSPRWLNLFLLPRFFAFKNVRDQSAPNEDGSLIRVDVWATPIVFVIRARTSGAAAIKSGLGGSRPRALRTGIRPGNHNSVF